ncbi:aldehyde dehydrogenase [Athelia psychrophila]|uniref:Aldehyde dehydrogenase n=2 Tax=Athelia psychrophila TaxID=1759441 RepID=A0A166PHS7_9AGAM|nr:aldehyde dehydrogenase [Fibularhizoctonia sp. CBS 109695]
MPTFTYEFDNESHKGTSTFETGLFINGQFVDGVDGGTIDVINPATGKILTKIAEARAKDIDIAVIAAQKAFDTVWGEHAEGEKRGILMNKLANLLERDIDQVAALEALDNGKPFRWAKSADVSGAIGTLRYYAGWADKIQGKQIPVGMNKLAYTRHEPMGVVGQIIPWNFPLLMLAWKIAPALATGNCIVLKPSEFTSLTALYLCKLINEAGFPPGVVNIVPGYGHIAGAALAEHMDVLKIAFTGSTPVGRKIMEAAAKTNLKNVTLELGGKSPNIVFDDADLDQAVNWTAFGIFWNQGQVCCAGSRIFVHANIYDEFLKRFSKKAAELKVGDPFAKSSFQGAQVSELQYDRIMSYIDIGKKEGATCHTGGARHGKEGYFIQPTIFTDVTTDMRIVREEIFGPVAVMIKFDDDDAVIKMANDTSYGLASAIFSQNITRAIKTAHKLHAGTAWINSYNDLDFRVPFGGYKQSGIGRDLGEYALANYTHIKGVHVNLGAKMT